MPSDDLEDSGVDTGLKEPIKEVEEHTDGSAPREKPVTRLPPLVISSHEQSTTPRSRKKNRKKMKTPTLNGDSNLSDISGGVPNDYSVEEPPDDHSHTNPIAQEEEDECVSPLSINAPRGRTPTELFMKRPTSADSSKSVKFKNSSETITYQTNSAVSPRGKGKGKQRPGSTSSDTPTGSKTSLQLPQHSPAPSSHSNEMPSFVLEPKVVVEEVSNSTPMNRLDIPSTSKDDDDFTPSDLFQGGKISRDRPATASKVVLETNGKPEVYRPKSAQKHVKKKPEPEGRSWFRKSRTTQSKISPHLYTSIALVLFCNILGVPALIASVLSYRSLKQGKEEDGRKYSKLAKIYTGVAFALGLLVALIVLIVYGVQYKSNTAS